MRDWKQAKPKHTTYRGEAIRRTTRGSGLVGVFGVPGLSSQRLCSRVGFPPGMRMARGKNLPPRPPLRGAPTNPSRMPLQELRHVALPPPSEVLGAMSSLGQTAFQANMPFSFYGPPISAFQRLSSFVRASRATCAGFADKGMDRRRSWLFKFGGRLVSIVSTDKH